MLPSGTPIGPGEGAGLSLAAGGWSGSLAGSAVIHYFSRGPHDVIS